MRALLRARRGELLGLTRQTISAVVPTLNAAGGLEDCLRALAGADEIVVADGGSSDGTAALVQAKGARLIDAPRGRGTQLIAGAKATRGDWLLIVHADTRLGPGWRAEADAHIAADPGRAACFQFHLDDPAWQARLLEAGVALRVRTLALPYGDQGLLISRELYSLLGGHAPLPLMEDVDLVRRIGRARLRTLPVPALTSADRWRRDGWARRSARNLFCLSLWLAGVSPARIARLYA